MKRPYVSFQDSYPEISGIFKHDQYKSIDYCLESIKNLNNYVENLKKNGMEMVIQVDTLGKIEKIGYISEDKKEKEEVTY